MAEAPKTEEPGTTHTYLAKAWYKDSATWFLIGSIAYTVLQDEWFMATIIPHAWHEAASKIILTIALVIRITKTLRPVAMRDGVLVEVRSIPPKGE
jgi:hypothetical protein